MKAREIALYQSPKCDLVIWTIERLDRPEGFQTLVWFPLNDETGYTTVDRAWNEEDALNNHEKWIKKLAINKKGGYSLSYEDTYRRLRVTNKGNI